LVIARSADIRFLITDRIGLDDAPEMFHRLRSPSDSVGVLVQPWR